MKFGYWCWCCFGVLFAALFEALVTTRTHFCTIDGRALAGMQVTVRTQFCKIDSRVLGGMQSGVLAQVLFFPRLTAGCSGSALWGCCSGCWRGLAFANNCRVLEGMRLGGARARFCEIDGRVLGACNLLIPAQVLLWDAAWGGRDALWAVLLEVLACNRWHVFRLGSMLVYSFFPCVCVLGKAFG